jgi:uncharacterized repeat protein (TIGR03803 family)
MRRNQLVQHLIAPTVVFAITLALGSVAWGGSTHKVLYSFTGGYDGGGVFAGVAIDAKGNLYGTTRGGGAHSEGTVFEVSHTKGGDWSEAVLESFCSPRQCGDGYLPESTPVFDKSGNLYGTSSVTAFELSPDAGKWRFKVISDNAGGSSLTIDGAGNLYGAGGSVWELVRASGWRVKEFHIFCRTNCRDGENALAPPVLDAAGNLYGTTEFGGNINTQWCPTSGGCGVAYQVEALAGGQWKYRVLHRLGAFSGDGQLPYAGVVVDSQGNVYGTTLQGGGCNGACGTVFKLTPGSDGHWKETILYNFNNVNDGADPAAALTFDKSGNLYGTASGGGLGNGVVFKMTPQAGGKWEYTLLHRFTGKDGYSPQAGVILDDKGNIYGTTTEGGSGGYGVVYEITP